MAKFKDVSGTYDTGRKATRIAVGFSPTEFARIRLLAHIDALRTALDGFMARRADLKPLLYDEFSTAQRVLDGDTDV